MINEAVQALLDKIGARDKVLQANKTWLRNVDNKVKTIEATTNMLTKVSSDIKKNQKQIKNLIGDLEQYQC